MSDSALSDPALSDIITDWLHAFEAACIANDAGAAAALFTTDGHWRDLVAFTWHIETASGHADIADSLGRSLERVRAHDFHIPADRMQPRAIKRAGRDVIEAIIGFETENGPCAGVLRLLPDGGGWDILERVLDLAAVGLAAEQVGGAQMCLDMAVDYAKVRVQFGRPIGSFQAIKHKCADMLLEVESAKSAAYYAGWAASEMNDELPSVASLAKAYCSEAYFHAAAENIQIHGGIGFTWEHPAHLYFKRAKSSELLFGDPTYHRELLAQRIGI